MARKKGVRLTREHKVLLHMFEEVVKKLDEIADEERTYRNPVIYRFINEGIENYEIQKNQKLAQKLLDEEVSKTINK